MNSSLNVYLTVILLFPYVLIVISGTKSGHKLKTLNKLSKVENFGAIDDNNADYSEIEKHIKRINLRNCGLKKATNYVINGTNADRNQYPFMVSLQYDGKHSCGGAIINQWWIITAAHCTFGDRSSYSIITGAHNISDGGMEYKIGHIIVHRKYDASTVLADIALLRVRTQIQFNSKVNSICLPTNQYSDPNGMLTVIGWGITDSKKRKSPEILQKVDLDIFSDERSANMLSEYYVEMYRSFVCAHTIRRGMCSGDSGGPAFQYINGRAVLVGIASFVFFSCSTSDPSCYTQVSYYLDWISYHILYNPKPSPRRLSKMN